MKCPILSIQTTLNSRRILDFKTIYKMFHKAANIYWKERFKNFRTLRTFQPDRNYKSVDYTIRYKSVKKFRQKSITNEL